MKSVNEAHRPHASASRPASGRRRLLTGVGGMAIALAGAFPSLAWADDYPVNSQADLIAAINTLNGNADLTPRIVLGASFTLNTTMIPLPTKSVTIDMQGYQINGGGNNVGFTGPFASGTLTLNGTITGASALQFDSLVTSGNGGLIVNNGTIAAAASAGAGLNPGVGVNLTNLLTFENSGTITGGTANAYVRPNGGSTSGSGISIFSGATVINDADGIIQGGNSQGIGAGAGIYSRNASNASFIQNNGQIFGGSDVTGVSAGSIAIGGTGLAGATITNTGTITGGNNAAAIGLVGINPWNVTVINDGTISAGTVGGNAIDMGTNAAGQLILELRSGSVINGNVVASSTGAVDYLRLGGSVDSSFDVTQIGAGAKYRNFEFFQKTGTSTWTLTGDSGRIGWNIVQGTLMIGDGATTGPQLGGVINNGTLIFNQTGTQNIDALAGASIGGSGSVVQNGTGTTILGGFNSYTGGTTLNNGVLQIFADGSLGNGGALTINGGTLRYIGSGASISRTINWGANGATFDITASNGSLSVSPLTNGGALIKTGLGMLILTGDNTYTGGTMISAGTLAVGGTILGDVIDNGTLMFSNSNAYTYAGKITGSGNVTAAGSALLTLTQNTTYGGATSVSGSGGLLITNGTQISYGGGTSISGVGAEFRIAGGAIVTSGGSTSLSRSTLTVDGANTLFTTASLGGTITGSGTAAINVTNGGTLRATTGGLSFRTIGTNVQLNIDGANSLADLAGGIQGATLTNAPFSTTISGGGTLRTAGTSQIGFANSTLPLAVSITGAGSNWTSSNSLLMTTGSFTLDQGGTASFTNATFGSRAPVLPTVYPATLTVSGANSQFTTTAGDLVIGSQSGTGALTLSNGGAVNVAGALVLADAGTATGILNIGGGEAQAAAASGAFNVSALNLGSATSRINFNHTDTNYLFGAAVSGAGAINQVAGDTNMTGNSALFTGTTNVSGGSLRVNGTLGGAGSTVNVLIGGRLGGAGTIGGNVTVAGGTLAPGNSPGTLTIGGNLVLAGGSVLDYEFGRSDTVGGPLNDLTVVGGNLTLGGTLNVTVTPGGDFGVGVYRVINYGGTLTNNGLTLGTMPAGSIVQLQTAVANQVNLVNIAGADVNFWDGNGARGDGVVSGGNGVWQNHAGNSNWTLADGSLNTAYHDGAFAIFSAAPGVVTVDGTGGAVTASGMQFASDGYVINGDAITLNAPQAIIRVGDGTTVGAGYTATIASALTSTGDVEKRDLGTLVLTGANSFAGDLYVTAGELRLAAGGTMSSVGGWIGGGTGAPAILTVTGQNAGGGASTWTVGDVTVGSGGTGALNITAGGQILSDTANIGDDGAGQVLVTGAGSAWQTTGRLNVGLWEAGSLRIADGALVSSQDAIAGTGANGDVVVTGAGSSWVSASQLTVGSFGTGSLLVEDGGSVTSEQGYIGANATGSVVVTGAGSNWQVTRYSMTVGNVGNGALTIADGGLVHAEGGLLLGAVAGSSGSLMLNGTAASRGALETNRIAAGQGAVTVTLDGGLIRAIGDTDTFFDGFDANTISLGANGGVIDTNGYSIGVSPSFDGSGALIKDGAGVLTLTGANSYNGGTTIAAGVLQLGDGGTTGAITGNVANNGSLVFFHSDNIGFAGLISGTGSVVQNGPGVLTLTGANSYSGGTTVSAGTLLVNGNQSAATGLVSVAAGATLGGSGTIGGDVSIANGGTLAPGNSPGTLTIDGNLALSAGSTLAYEFGQKNVVGGAFNDLVNVGGNLTLDGTINVSVPTGGSFDLGLYRIINYAGALTDNGLAIGTMPVGADVFVQTSVAGQVNLINTGGALLNFWDGDAAGNAFNGAIDGGNGSWLASTGTAWADATGAVNASYANGAFAIFTGASGVVTIDNSRGAVTASGMQFASDGYVIAGDTLTLTGPQAVIRVGDGSAAGGGYTATIDAAIAGAAQLVKTDAGTLVLGGTNSYIGGTAINGGTLQIASDANLGAATGGLSFNGGTLATTADISSARAIDLAGPALFSTGAGTVLTLTGAISGAGNLGKADSGTLILAGTGSFTGGTTVTQGTLLVNGNYAAATGLTDVGAAATLGGTGTIGGNVRISGTLAPGAGGAGTLTIGGNLTLVSTATLAYDFGQANVAGGALNDLVNVGGNLVLDGTVNVSVPTGGSFGAGVYRLFNYGGTLTDNGLTLGNLPAGSNVAVQTSIAGQVNLINFAGLSLNFWDGVAGPKNNGAINGGSGVWQNSTGNDNWTDANGLVNAAYSDASFAVFGGTAGTVTVDNSLGAVSAAGMQFATSGYVIAGDAITLTGPQAVIRVGDGSAAGAGFVATINAALSGSAQLVKTDAGTLVLAGTNSYTGGTAINGGTLQIAGDASLGAASGGISFDGGTLATSATLTSNRAVTVVGTGTIATANATTFTLAGALSGTGALTKAGGGTLLLTGDSSGYAGATHVAAGTLAVTGALGGTMTVGSGARLEGTGSVGAVTNFGVVAPGRDSFGTLTMASYAGAGGRLEIRTALGGDASPADRLVAGTTAGTTTIDVINRGGLGAQTVEGVKIVDVTGASNGTFLLHGDYVFGGEQAVIAGAYGYRLYKGGVSTPTDGDWYLRSSLLVTPEQPQVPLYQPGVPVYEAYGQTLLALTDVGTMQQRTGNRQWAATESGKPSGIWGRMQAGRSRPNATVSTSLADVNVDSWKMEIGADHVLSERGDGASLVLGVLGSYGEANANVASLYGNGAIKTKGYGAGATLTWFGPAGFYVDSRAQLTWFDSRLRSAVLGTLADGNHGFGQAYSLEVGKRAPVGGKLSVTPQIQMVYQHVGFDRFTDPNDATVSSGRGGSLKSRWGLSVDRQDARSYVYGVANLSYEWLDGMVTDVSGTPIRRENHRLWGELGVGGSALIGNRVTLFTEASANTAINDFGKSYNLKGTAGLRLAF